MKFVFVNFALDSSSPSPFAAVVDSKRWKMQLQQTLNHNILPKQSR